MINAIKSYLNVVDIYLSLKPTMGFHSLNTKVCSCRYLNLISCKTKDFYLKSVKDYVRLGPNTSPIKNNLKAIFKFSYLVFLFYLHFNLIFILHLYIKILAVLTTFNFVMNLV